MDNYPSLDADRRLFVHKAQATDLLAEIEGIKGFSVLALDWVAEDEVPTLSIEYDEPLGNDTDSLTARVAWNVGQNKLVGDAVRRSAAKFPLKVILHQSQSLLARLLLIMRNWPDTLSAWREKKQDPDAYAINLVKHKEVFRKLMEHAISLISIYIGDIRQLPPIAVTVDQQDFNAIVSLQKKTILFHRMENAGQVHFRLHRNYRAYVHSHELAQNMLYGDLRGQENSEPYFCGTSYYNEGYANFVIQLIIQFYRQPNPIHKNKYQYLLNEVTAAELPKSLVDVRTIIDDSFSPEADQVFIDLI
ncbi:uncharacterized protein FFMR_08015 [Fusarium fujikuroi]|nr:uncharacterized protein FFNC_02473 [Fusarium fujikuroi]SCO45399.1 uncharacterized protein FFMR_08015 [Fusarium fujikuroi]SCV44900.1 uncharacterized protein FFFS_07100 [Fusarium fujikuroi]